MPHSPFVVIRYMWFLAQPSDVLLFLLRGTMLQRSAFSSFVVGSKQVFAPGLSKEDESAKGGECYVSDGA